MQFVYKGICKVVHIVPSIFLLVDKANMDFPYFDCCLRHKICSTNIFFCRVQKASKSHTDVILLKLYSITILCHASYQLDDVRMRFQFFHQVKF